VLRLAVLAAVLALSYPCAYFTMIKMPGKSYAGPLPPLTDAQLALRDELRRDVQELAAHIGERNIFNHAKLAAAADFIEAALTRAGYEVTRQNFQAYGKTCCNLIAQITGRTKPDQIIIIGAHYDSVYGSPGANDNASAVAAALALARRFAGANPARTLRFLFFANEEPPFYMTGEMGSLVYARSCRRKNENIAAMLSLETIGHYTDQPNSQKYPPLLSLFYPSTGNFLAFVSNLSSRKVLRRVVASFRENCKFPSEAGAYPSFVPGIAWSDHWSFWRHGYPAIMITDTAPFRYPYYHSPEDTPDKIDYDRLPRVISGIEAVIRNLVTSQDQ